MRRTVDERVFGLVTRELAEAQTRFFHLPRTAPNLLEVAQDRAPCLAFDGNRKPPTHLLKSEYFVFSLVGVCRESISLLEIFFNFSRGLKQLED